MEQTKRYGIGNHGVQCMRKTFLLLSLALFSLAGLAQKFTFDGEIWSDNSNVHYNIVIEINRASNGAITGRYAYNSTLRKKGRNARSSWLYFRRDGNSTENYFIIDSDGKVQEYWSDVSINTVNGITFLSAQMTNVKRRNFSITAVTGL